MVRGMENKNRIYDPYTQTFTTFLRSLGEMLIAYGELETLIEQEFGQKLEKIDFMELLELGNLEDKIKSTDPEVLGKFAIVMFEFMSLTRKIKDINALPPEEKKKLGERLKKLAEDFEELTLIVGEKHGDSSPKANSED